MLRKQNRKKRENDNEIENERKGGFENCFLENEGDGKRRNDRLCR